LRFPARCYPLTVVSAFAFLGFVLLLTPTGSPPTRDWRWWMRFTAVTPAVLAMVVPVLPTLKVRSRPVDNPFDLRSFDEPLLAVTGAVGLVGWSGSVGVVILPPTIGASLLRYRLYDVDRIVSRGGGLPAPASSHADPDGSPLQPTSLRCPGDGARLRDGAAGGAGPPVVRSALAAVVSDTMQPARLSLWMAEPESARSGARPTDASPRPDPVTDR
jgi:hypothetical protein